jgi:hypothetical protein
MTDLTLRDKLASAMLELGTLYNALAVAPTLPDDGQAAAVLEAILQGGVPNILKGPLSWLVLDSGQAIKLDSMEQMYRELDHDSEIARKVWAQIGGHLKSLTNDGIDAFYARHADGIAFMEQS